MTTKDNGVFLFGGLKPHLSTCSALQSLADLMVEAEGAELDTSRDNLKIPAAWTYLGQLLNHDIHVDTELGERESVPALDLDCIYGSGPRGSPDLYSTVELGAFELSGCLDLPRHRDGHARIADRRNDQTVMLGQLHLALLRFHNAVRIHLLESGDASDDDSEAVDLLFDRTRQLVVWHYQWIVVEKFLAMILDPLVRAMVFPAGGKPRPRFYDLTRGPHLPLEFSVAAFRFGHTMPRPSYRLNGFTADLRPNGIPLFVRDTFGDEFADLRGERPLPEGWVAQWDMFLPFLDSNPQYSRRIDPLIARPLTLVPSLQGVSLALRTLRRGLDARLPSGQTVSKAIGAKTVNCDRDDPLWYYILTEADQQKNGSCLGEVGSVIVADVILGLLMADPRSYLAADPKWKPVLRNRFGQTSGDFDLADLLQFAGMPMNLEQVRFSC